MKLRPLARVLLLVGVALFALAATAIIAIRAQPYDERELRAFFAFTDECPMPCWQGIRPGVTSAEDAITLLEKHPWVKHVAWPHSGVSEFEDAVVRWLWNDERPTMVVEDSGGTLMIRDGVVEQLSLRTQLTLGQIALLFGEQVSGHRLWIQPNRTGAFNATTTAASPAAVAPLLGYQGSFAEAGVLAANLMLPCPLDLYTYWRMPVMLELRADVSRLLSPDSLDLHHIAATCLTPVPIPIT